MSMEHQESGRLRDVFNVSKPALEKDNRGGMKNTTASVGQVRGYSRPMSGREGIGAQRNQATMTHVVMVRMSNVDIKPDYQLFDTFNNRTFHVIAVADADRRRHLWKLLCSEEWN